MVTSDAALKQYLVWLQNQGQIEPFIMEDLDDTHLFVSADVPRLAEVLQAHIDKWHDDNTFVGDEQEETKSKKKRQKANKAKAKAKRSAKKTKTG